MRLSPELEQALNGQINNELAASYSYLAMSGYFESRSLPGFAALFREQSREESTHADKIYDYIFRRDGAVTLMDIPAPKHSYSTVEELMRTALAQEEQVTAQILALYAMAVEQGDAGTRGLLEWFVTEQEEEEDKFRTLLDQVAAAGEDSWRLQFLDREISAQNPAPAA